MSFINNHMKNRKKIYLPILVISIFVILAQIVSSNPPENKRKRASSQPQISVDVETIKQKSFKLMIDSYGKIKPRTQSILFPQVSGQIIDISSKIQAGSFFEKGDVLLTLDDRDLKAEIKISKANLLSAKQQLSEELARVEQAKEDWKRLGKGETAPELVLRKPQLLAMEAKVLSAEASLDKALLALDRSQIVAPYTGRVLTKHVDLGQVVSPNTQLAEIYAVDYVEIRLPLKNKDLPFINLPEQNRYKANSANSLPNVTISSDISQGNQWLGKVVRTEGAFDQASQQLFVVAQIDDPYGSTDQGLPLKIGQYVNAKIEGVMVENAITIPNSAIYQGSYVYIVEQGLLKRKEIETIWQNSNIAIVEQGLVENDLLVLTPLGQVNSGTPVSFNQKDGRIAKAKKDKPRGKHSDKKRKAKNSDEQSKKRSGDKS